MNSLSRPLCMSVLACALIGCIDIGGSNNSAGGSGGDFDNLPSAPTAPTDLCTPVAGGGSSISSNIIACPTCRIENLDAAFDGRLDSAATLVFSPAGQITVNGRVQLGTVVPGDNIGGIALQFAREATVAVTVTTLLNGVPTGSCLTQLRGAGTTSSDSIGVNCNLQSRPGEPSFFGVQSPAPFNEIRADLDYGDTGTENTVPVFELCMR